MLEPVDVSFIIPSFRSRATIGGALQAVLGQRTGLRREVVVVDSSDDGTGDWVQERFPAVRLVRSSSRLLPGAARNRGVEVSRGDWLAFVDSDAAPAPDWLEVLFSRLRDRSLALTGGWVGNANPETIASRVLHWIEFSEVVPGSASGSRGALSSSNWLLSKATFVAGGGFSEELAMAEDLLFCQRLQGAIHFEGSTGVWHHHRSQWPEAVRHLYQLGLWSGRYRSRFQTTGSWLADAPWASVGVPPARAAKILSRITRADPAEGAKCLLHLPWIARGLQRWGAGFRAGLGE